MNATVHAWDCPCGIRNARHLVECRRCKCPQRDGRTVYWVARTGRVRASPPPAPPSNAQAKTTFPWIWALAGFVILAISLSRCGSAPSRHPERNAVALREFRKEIALTSNAFPGIILSVSETDLQSPVVVVSDFWHQAPRQTLRDLTESLGHSWEQCRSRAGLDSAGTVYIQDVGGHEVAKYGPFNGARLQ